MNVDALFAILTLFALVGVYLGPWQSVCTAYARQVIFEKRDRLFDMARDGDLEFDSHEYREIRSSLEKLIRFAHELTLLNFLMLRRHMRRNFRSPVSELHRNVQAVDGVETRRKVEALVAEAHEAALLMMFAKSIVALPFIAAYVALCALRSHSSVKIRQLIQPYGEMVQVEAEAARVNTREYVARTI